MNVTDNLTPFFTDLANRKEMQKAVKKAQTKIAQGGVRAVKTEFRKTGIKHKPKTKSKYGDPAKGIKGYIIKDTNVVKLSIMGDFRLKWFEKGTVERATKAGGKRKSHRTGKIKSYLFFSIAVQQYLNEVKDIYAKSFEEALNKILRKTK